jgi:PAS domain S-box-containing protein
MNSSSRTPAIPWAFFVLFLVISATAILSGYLIYKSQGSHLMQNSTKELSAIADLKVRQIVQWRGERRSDGAYLSQNIFLASQFSRWLSVPGDKRLKENLLYELKVLTDSYDYRTALFLDPDCKVRLFYPDADTVIGDYLRSRLPEIVQKGEVELTDLHKTGKVSFVHLDMIVPIKINENGSSKLSGLLVLRIDPQKVLFPLIDSWPVTSKTSETLLFREEGDSIVYLNQLRHMNNPGSLPKGSALGKDNVAAMAIQGFRETTNAVDYRGVSIIGAMKKVPESTWYMVAKVDREEILSQIKDHLSSIVIIVILFILTAGLILGFIIRNQRVRFYRTRYETELNRLALVRHYEFILKNANDIILLTDRNFKIIEANDKAFETYQFTREEFIGMNVSKLRANISFDNLLENLKIIDDSGHSTFETVHRRKDGTTFPIETSARMVDIEGVKYYQSISRDITERKKVEESLRESEERFRKVFEDSPFGMVMTGKDLGIIKANSSFCKMIGYKEETLLGMTLRDFTHPDYIARDELSIMKLVAKEFPIYRTEKKYVRNNGSVIWGSTTVSLIRNKKSEIQLFFAMVEDITSRKIAEEELEKSFSLQKATLESTADGILVVDNEGKIVQYNQKFTEMWQIPRGVLETKDDETVRRYVLKQLKDPDSFTDKVEQLYSDSEAITFDLLEFIDGKVFERYSQPQKLGGKSVGRVWSFRDITERKKAETDLIAAKEKAEEGDRLKTAFLHNVSHEIRTPMNAILGFSTLLNEPGVTESERKQFTDVIFQSGTQLLSIINDIVDLASIESGQVRLNMKEINLNNTLRSIIDQFSYKQISQKITLSVSTPLDEKNSQIITDGTKLVQIISNLINNAFKFTKKGKIVFGYELNKGFLDFFVKDTGIGIHPEHLSKIFNRFYQVDNTISRQYSGTGLGLSICKAYVELFGGTIDVFSEPGKGTNFTFTIPYIRKEDYHPDK